MDSVHILTFLVKLHDVSTVAIGENVSLVENKFPNGGCFPDQRWMALTEETNCSQSLEDHDNHYWLTLAF